MNKSILSLIGIAVLVMVVVSGCVGNNSSSTTTPTTNVPSVPGDSMQSATPSEVADSVSGLEGVTETELNELDSLVQDIESSTTEIQESNI